MIQWSASGAYAQSWKIETTGCTSTTTTTPPTSATTCYKITNRSSGKSIGVEAALTTDGASVKQQTYANQPWQKWELRTTGTANTYQLAAIHSGKVLAVQGASTQGWASVIQSTNTNANNQKWVIQTGSDGYSTLKAVHSNLMLDIANQDEGGQVIQWASSGAYAQYWKLEMVGCTSSGRLAAEIDPILKVYPNPAQDYVDIDISVSGPTDVELSLLNVTGRRIYSEIIKLDSSTIHRLSLTDLPTGLYLIQLQAGDQWTRQQRLLVSH